MQILYLFLFILIPTICYIKIIPFFQNNLYSLPTNRGLHNYSKPTSGGIIFVLIFVISSLINKVYLPLLSLPLAFMGLIDDKFNIPGKQKYIYQLITVFLIIIYTTNFNNNYLSQIVKDNTYVYIILLFVGTAIINIINFMDGIDGLIAGTSLIIFSSIFYNNFFYIIPLICSLLVFLYFNWNPSRIFMGDSGSLFIGSYLLSLIYTSQNFNGSFKIILLCLPLLIDSSICILRRLINRQNIFQPHKLHLYQRLVSNGLKHSTVSSIYIISIFILGLLYCFSNLISMFICNGIIVIFGLYLNKKFALKFIN
tara:strand:+ start:240 stop:1172 length:933 start_codon:yes stop_codon:yes gene_type:complete